MEDNSIQVEILEKLYNNENKINLIFAFNGTGKTTLSMQLKDYIKEKDKKVFYYNSFTEDLFSWDNDIDNNHRDPILKINKYNNFYNNNLIERELYKELQRYNLGDFDFKFSVSDIEKDMYDIIKFFSMNQEEDLIKISRAEERIFIWCYFIASLKSKLGFEDPIEYIIIDDPVSSLDDNNLIKLILSISYLIEDYIIGTDIKLIIFSHNTQFYNTLYKILQDNKKLIKEEILISRNILKREGNTLKYKSFEKKYFYYHLYILEKIQKHIDTSSISIQDINLFRQLLEFTASFTGKFWGELLGEKEKEYLTNMCNTYSHYNDYTLKTPDISSFDEKIFRKYFQDLKNCYGFNKIKL